MAQHQTPARRPPKTKTLAKPKPSEYARYRQLINSGRASSGSTRRSSNLESVSIRSATGRNAASLGVTQDTRLE